MRSKGFTLIELLAVIVILAIIALIAVPIVLNIIKDSKESATLRSTELYLDAVNLAIAKENMTTAFPSGEIECDLMGEDPEEGYDSNDLICNGVKIRVDINGDAPIDGKVKLSNGKIVHSQETYLTMSDNKTYSYNNGKIEIVATPSAITIYRWSSEEISIGDTIDVADTTKYTDDPSTLGRSYYLKHIVENDQVKETYVCIKSSTPEYCFKGGNASYYADNVTALGRYQSDHNLSNSATGDYGCVLNGTNNSNCANGMYRLFVYPTGGAKISNGDSEDCEIQSDGTSSCYDMWGDWGF